MNKTTRNNNAAIIHDDRLGWDVLALRLRALRAGIQEDELRARIRAERLKPHWPDEAVLLAYTEGRLGWFTRKRVEAHLASCADCVALLAESAEITKITAGRDI